MFLQEGQRFTESDNYRDDTLGQQALRLAQSGPLIVTGVAGIGKSWFLRRLAALAVAKESRHFSPDGAPVLRRKSPEAITAVEAYDARADGPNALAEALTRRLKRPDARRLLLIDEADALLAPAFKPGQGSTFTAPAADPLIEAISRYEGPLVIAAPPSILSISAFGRCRSLVVPPLSPPERRALLLQTCDPGAGLDAERAALGLHSAWGGHPRILQQVGALLRDAPAETLEGSLEHLVEVVSDRLEGYAAAITASVMAIEQEALLSVAWEEAISERLRGAALSLTLHGVLLRQSDSWAVENRVLARQLAHEPR